jgi:hypothetical protein
VRLRLADAAESSTKLCGAPRSARCQASTLPALTCTPSTPSRTFSRMPPMSETNSGRRTETPPGSPSASSPTRSTAPRPSRRRHAGAQLVRLVGADPDRPRPA